MAFSLTGDAGCEYGGGVTLHGGKGGPKQAFLGWMAYNRMWFHKDLFALTLGGGMMNNPGRYLTLLPPINGADAISGSPYFTAESRATRPTCGMPPSISNTCPSSTSPGGWRPVIATPMFRIGRAAAESRLPAATTALLAQFACMSGGAVRHKRSGDSVRELRWTRQCLVPRSSPRPGDRQRWRHGEVLVGWCVRGNVEPVAALHGWRRHGFFVRRRSVASRPTPMPCTIVTAPRFARTASSGRGLSLCCRAALLSLALAACTWLSFRFGQSFAFTGFLYLVLVVLAAMYGGFWQATLDLGCRRCLPELFLRSTDIQFCEQPGELGRARRF